MAPFFGYTPVIEDILWTFDNTVGKRELGFSLYLAEQGRNMFEDDSDVVVYTRFRKHTGNGNGDGSDSGSTPAERSAGETAPAEAAVAEPLSAVVSSSAPAASVTAAPAPAAAGGTGTAEGPAAGFAEPAQGSAVGAQTLAEAL